jgi:hypothetical protein
VREKKVNWVVRNIKWIMLVSGVLTCTMLFAAIAPNAALEMMFGESLQGPLAEIVVRNWAALIGIVGAMLIYGAYSPSNRMLVLSVASISKAIYIGLILGIGSQYLNKTGLSIAFDFIVIILFCTYLLAVRGERSAA